MTIRQITFVDLPVSPHSILQSNFAATYGNTNSIITAFQGDLSNVAYSTGKSLSTAAIKSPVLNYENFPENSVNYTYLYNPSGSGFNLSLSGNGNRTGVSTYFTKVDNYGQGDAFAYFGKGFVISSNPGATSFLANAAVTLFAGDTSAGSAGVYLNPVEIDTKDNGFDIAAINFVANQSRSNNTGALGCVWFGYRSQNSGSAEIDAHFTAAGKAKLGLDLTSITTNASGTWTNSAIALLGGDRIYLNASAGATSPGYASTPGTTYLYYANSGIQGIANGTPAFLFGTSTAFLYASTITLAQNSNNRIQVQGAASGSPPQIKVTASSDTNQDLFIGALGSGNVAFTNAGSFSANGAIATSLGSIGPTGSHTTVQEWLTIKDASGTVRYIPCF